jgi:TonB family protein
MRDKLFTYALAVSIAVHGLVLGLVGKTSASKPIDVAPLKLVKVDLVKTPDEVAVQTDKPDTPKPQVAESPPPEAPYVPPPSAMVEDKHPPKPIPRNKSASSHIWHPNMPVTPIAGNTTRTNVAKLPGDPGGALAGVTSPNGENLGIYSPNGRTPVGTIPGADNGQGSGSGSGPGIGSNVPDTEAHSGPGNVTSPGIPPVVLEQKYVTVTICSESGLLPGPYCDNKRSKSFKEGTEPDHRCNICKAPHVNKWADAAEPELVKDIQPKIPDIDESGDYKVVVHYTVNTDGSVSNVEITDSSGVRAIDRAIVEAASKLRYKPAVQNGEPRSVKIKRTYRINI